MGIAVLGGVLSSYGVNPITLCYSFSLLRGIPPLGFPKRLLFSFLVSSIMVDDVTNTLENMRLTMVEEVVIDIPNEG